MTETVEKTATGAILYDQAIINQISEKRFEASGWLHSEPVAGRDGSAGRGTTMYVGNVPRQFVLRHYRRGGLVGRVVAERYVWAGEDRTRSFREWRLLAKLADRGMRVPRPAAARYRRVGPGGAFYTADLITVRIPGVRPLSAAVAGSPCGQDFWAGLGAQIREFHAAGVFHADMNAHNLQVDDDGRLWMLDFDRGALRPPGAWQQQTLARLHRSLEKIRTRNEGVHFDKADWDALLEGYFQASRSV